MFRFFERKLFEFEMVCDRGYVWQPLSGYVGVLNTVACLWCVTIACGYIYGVS